MQLKVFEATGKGIELNIGYRSFETILFYLQFAKLQNRTIQQSTNMNNAELSTLLRLVNQARFGPVKIGPWSNLQINKAEKRLPTTKKQSTCQTFG